MINTEIIREGSAEQWQCSAVNKEVMGNAGAAGGDSLKGDSSNYT